MTTAYHPPCKLNLPLVFTILVKSPPLTYLFNQTTWELFSTLLLPHLPTPPLPYCPSPCFVNSISKIFFKTIRLSLSILLFTTLVQTTVSCLDFYSSLVAAVLASYLVSAHIAKLISHHSSAVAVHSCYTS